MKSMLKGIKKRLAHKNRDSNGKNGALPSDEVVSASPALRGAGGSVGEEPNVGSEDGKFSAATLLRDIPSFREVKGPVEQKALLVKKLQLCCVMFDWNEEDGDSTLNNSAKEVKRQQLLELVDFIGQRDCKHVFTDSVLEETVKMVSTNLFRALPPQSSDDGGVIDEDDPVYEPSWPHLQIVYEFFLRFVVSNDVEVRNLKRHINGRFVLSLLDLFHSEDHRERDYLKTILHRIYAKFMSLRAFIRKAVHNVFYAFIYEDERHCGVAELLEILGSIINGFALPLKAEHKLFLERVLTPMHKVKGLAMFHQQLAYCVVQFVDKDATLAVPVLRGLVKYWPAINSNKEVLFLNEVEELLELTQPEEFRILVPVLFRQLGRSIGSPHFQVAERALFLWHNEYISGLIADLCVEVLTIIYPVLHVNSEAHWNPTVQNLTSNVLGIFRELDPELVDECCNAHSVEHAQEEAKRVARKRRWEELEAAKKAKQPPLPQKPTHRRVESSLEC